jgi:hypothetical protein
MTKLSKKRLHYDQTSQNIKPDGESVSLPLL